MVERWQVIGADWTGEPEEGAWWDALARTLQHELAGARPLGLRIEVGVLGELALHDLDEQRPLRMRRVDQAWSSHRWSQTGATDRPLILNEDMPYLNLGQAGVFSPNTLDEADEEARPSGVDGDQEIDTAPVIYEWGTGTVPAVAPVARVADDALAARVEAACQQLDAAGSREEASAIALDVLRRFINVERGAVMLTTADPTRFEVAVLRGVRAAAEGRIQAPCGRGLGDFVASTGTAVMVNAPGASPLFRPAEIATGEASQALFAIPVLDLRSGMLKGVIELSRPSLRFQHWQLEVGVAVGAALAEALQRISARAPRRMAWAG